MTSLHGEVSGASADSQEVLRHSRPDAEMPDQIINARSNLQMPTASTVAEEMDPASPFHWDNINSPDPMQRASGERTRRKLQFFFMNPIDKWRARRRPPYKLTVQLVKVVLVTVQLCMFANRRFSHVTYVADSLVSFQHLLVLGWEPMREVNTYPPSAGPLAIYSGYRFFDTLDFAVNAYYNLSSLAVSSVDYPADSGTISQLCVEEYKHVRVDPAHHSFSFDSRSQTRCLLLKPNQAQVNGHNFSTKAYAATHNFSLSFVGMTETRVSFSLNAIKLKLVMPLDVPDCYRFNITLLLDNSNQDGQILVSMKLDAHELACDSDVEFLDDNNEISVLFTAINVIVVLLCLTSLAMCIRSIYRGQMLRRETAVVLNKHFRYQMNDSENMRFLNLWYVLIIINDILIVLGSLIQIELENKAMGYSVGADTWNACSLFLGVGNLLAWIGVLRYFGFFKSYNVLILTVKKSMPNVLRFSVCATICYGGFVFCGWLVLSPYNMKFRTLSCTSETLFSLMNGDDMFATFSQMSTKTGLVFWFSKVYVYVFVFFFIYVVLSLMISIIMDAYETIKAFYKDGFPQTPLDEFVAARRLDPNSGVYREEQDERLFFRLLAAVCNCCSSQTADVDTRRQQGRLNADNERTPLMNT